MNVYRYETPQIEIESLIGPTIFLMGPTVRGHQPHLTSWRFEAIEEFSRQGFGGNLVVPEFATKEESDKGKKWIPRWEFTGLKRADCIMCWLPRTRELIALTTNHELGYWMARDRNKLVYGRPDDAYRIDYTDTMWELDFEDRVGDRAFDDIDYGIQQPKIYNTLHDTIAASIKKISL